MLDFTDGLILYHGSYCEVKKPLLERCARRIAGSKEADDFCIKQLLPNKLKDQYCFKTTAALDCLHFVESEKIWLKK